MKTLFYVILLSISVFAGIWLRNDPGLIQINFSSWVIELPIWLGIIFFAGAVFALIVIFELLRFLFNLPKNLEEKIATIRRRSAHTDMRDAIISLLNEDWQKTYMLSKRALKKRDKSIASNIVAAFAANKLNYINDRDSHIAKANQLLGKSSADYKMLTAKLYNEAGSIDTAKKILESNKNNSKEYYNTILDIYKSEDNWQLIKDLLPKLRSNKILTESELNNLSVDTYKNLLLQSITENSTEKVMSCWIEIPKNIRNNPSLTIPYAKHLINTQKSLDAEKEIENSLHINLNSELLLLLAKINNSNNNNRIKFLEKLLAKNKDNHYLLFTLGKTCINAKLWGKAKDYLEASLGIEKIPETYLELAGLANILDNQEEANKYYKEGFLLQNRE